MKSLILHIGLLFALVATPGFAQEPSPTNSKPPAMDPGVFSFASLLVYPDDQLTDALNYIEQNWQPGYAAMALDILALNRRSTVRSFLVQQLEKHSGQKHTGDLHDWYHWLWQQDEMRYADYAELKSLIYGLIDRKFRGYFDVERQTDIRLDEVLWGGVVQDGIPPLRQPKMIEAAEANYLQDDNVVFGIEINGDARAYPNRILAWHEMFVDEIGGVPFAGVYCTLCGAVILYETQRGDTNYQMGTSGFLYRSNKLMYDKATQSLWSTTRGEPVIGPLVGKGVTLQRSFLVTTTWGEWKKRHPHTTVLSLDTGHDRNYDEGVAYKDYFATNELMFAVPEIDARLNNKDEILALTFPAETDQTLAIHADYLASNPVHHDQLGPVPLVVLTDPSGANRVFHSGTTRFTGFDGNRTATDEQGLKWTMTEAALTSENGEQLARLPAHRAFWFGWQAVHNDTRLVK